VNLLENPIFLTQRRLVHRAGVMVALLLAGLIGGSLLFGLVAYISGGSDLHFLTNQQAGKTFYGWVLALELIMLPIVGTSRVARALSEDRRAGLWESNRLTPLTPAQLVTGYWLGSPLREYYAAVVFAACGLAIVLLSGLPITFWLATQTLVLSTALFLGLLGALAGITAKKSEGGAVLFLMMIIVLPLSMAQSRLLVTNFILPIFGLANQFAEEDRPGASWFSSPTFFGVEVPALVFTLTLQAMLAIFLWRAVTRKAANPFQLLLPRWEAVALFVVLLAAQHGLMWAAWHGYFPMEQGGSQRYYDRDDPIMGVVQVCTMVLGMMMLVFASPLPEQVRLAALRAGWGNFRLVLARSALWQAVAFALLADGFLLTQFMFSLGAVWNAQGHSREIFAIAALNLFDFFLIFTLLLEICRLRFRHGTMGFVGLGLFILCILPYILAGVFSNESIADFSLLSPGVRALTSDAGDKLDGWLDIVLLHLGMVVLLFIIWVRSWKWFLARAVPGHPISSLN
jgi:hypothetical protein